MWNENFDNSDELDEMSIACYPTIIQIFWLSMRNKELRKRLLRESEGVSNCCFGYIISMPKDLFHIMASKMYNKYVLFQF